MNDPRMLAKLWRCDAAKCRKVAVRPLVRGSTFAKTLNIRADTFDACARQLEESLGEPLERMNES